MKVLYPELLEKHEERDDHRATIFDRAKQDIAKRKAKKVSQTETSKKRVGIQPADAKETKKKKHKKARRKKGWFDVTKSFEELQRANR